MTSREPVTEEGEPVRQPSKAFLVGIALGGAVFCSLVIWNQGIQPNIRIVVDGANVSRSAGVKISILNERGVLTQTCSGTCDDLEFAAESSDNVYSIKIVDQRGICVICDTGGYVTNGLHDDWRVSGREKLTLNRTGKASD